MSCNQAGMLGQCLDVPLNMDDANGSTACMGTQACDGNGLCKGEIGHPCNQDSQCLSNNCPNGAGATCEP